VLHAGKHFSTPDPYVKQRCAQIIRKIAPVIKLKLPELEISLDVSVKCGFYVISKISFMATCFA